MLKQTALITLAPQSDERSGRELRLRLEALGKAQPFSCLGAGLPIGFRGGDLVWHLHFPDEAAWRASGAFELLDELEAGPLVGEIDAAVYETARFAAPEPALRNGVYRTLFVSFDPTLPAETRLRFADELARMPEHVPEIRNWGMNSTLASRGERPWTHVWEQEFREAEHLTGPYMRSAYHWAWVDRWFDAEMPDRAVPTDGIRHSASELAESVIRRYERAASGAISRS